MHTTPASSSCVQSLLPQPRDLQDSMLFSPPLHSTLSSQIFPGQAADCQCGSCSLPGLQKVIGPGLEVTLPALHSLTYSRQETEQQNQNGCPTSGHKSSPDKVENFSFILEIQNISLTTCQCETHTAEHTASDHIPNPRLWLRRPSYLDPCHIWHCGSTPWLRRSPVGDRARWRSL